MNNNPATRNDSLPGDHELELRARAIFRSACEGTDSWHALRLGQARRKAAEAASGRSPLARWFAPLAGGAVACCALAIGVVALRPGVPTTGVQNSTPLAQVAPQARDVTAEDAAEDAPDVASNQADMVQNLDFYKWLANQPSVAAASGGSGN